MTHRLINTDGNDMYVFEFCSEARVAVRQFALTPSGWLPASACDIVKAPTAREWYRQVKARGFTAA